MGEYGRFGDDYGTRREIMAKFGGWGDLMNFGQDNENGNMGWWWRWDNIIGGVILKAVLSCYFSRKEEKSHSSSKNYLKDLETRFFGGNLSPSCYYKLYNISRAARDGMILHWVWGEKGVANAKERREQQIKWEVELEKTRTQEVQEIEEILRSMHDNAHENESRSSIADHLPACRVLNNGRRRWG